MKKAGTAKHGQQPEPAPIKKKGSYIVAQVKNYDNNKFIRFWLQRIRNA